MQKAAVANFYAEQATETGLPIEKIGSWITKIHQNDIANSLKQAFELQSSVVIHSLHTALAM